jgi:steroid 5-alpha reductase family enzyme
VIITAIVFAAPGGVTGYAAIAVAALMLGLWLLSIPLRDVSIVDPAWGPAFVLVALVAALTADGCLGRRRLLLGLTALWGLRLGASLLVRKLGDPDEDRRYAAMRERRGSSFVPWSLVAIFGLLSWRRRRSRLRGGARPAAAGRAAPRSSARSRSS